MPSVDELCQLALVRSRRRCPLSFGLCVWLTAGLALCLAACNREPQEIRLYLNVLQGATERGPALQYAPAELYLPAATRVAITLYNRASEPALAHNFVLVQPGSVESVAAASLSVSALPGHVPSHEAVLASSPLIQSGESSTFRFMAPPPGAYEFLCTEPGHPLLRGRFIVQ